MMIRPFLDLFGGDWLVAALLGFWSVLGLTVILERIYALWNASAESARFSARVLDRLRKGEYEAALTICQESNAPLAPVFMRGLSVHREHPGAVAEALATQRSATLGALRARLWLLATVGSSAPFVGLFGTVIGVIRAFHSMAAQGVGGFKVVAAGLSEALVATAAGLVIAIYALVAYNWFVARLSRLGLDFRLLCDDLVLALGGNSGGRAV
jgi:biopolymer transport protein ExbB/TolQ